MKLGLTKFFVILNLICFIEACFAKDHVSNDLLSNLKAGMMHSNEQMKTVNTNISQVNIPGAKAKIIPAFSPKKNNRKLGMKSTSPMHIKNANAGGSKYRAEYMKDTFETNPNGNNINLVEQNMLLSDTAIDNKTFISGYKAFSSMLKTAISGK